jgi:hypothetical protein
MVYLSLHMGWGGWVWVGVHCFIQLGGWNTLFYEVCSRWGVVGGFSRGLRDTGFVRW